MTNNFINIRLGNTRKNDSVTVEQSLIETTANIVGTSYKGKAFVPQKLFAGQTTGGFPVYNTLNNTLGNYRENQIAHLYDDFACYVDSMAYDAASMWLNNGGVYSSFTRVLGIGTGVVDAQSGKMIGSGFNVANNISSGTLTQTRSNNLNAIAGGEAGSTNFILQKVSENSTSTTTQYADPTNIGYLNELGYYKDGVNHRNNISANTSFLTDVFLFASGVLPNLSGSLPDQQTTYTTTAATYTAQTKTSAAEDCYIKLLGFSPKNETGIRNAIRIKHDGNNYLQKSTDYKSNLKNQFSSRLLEKGHYLYSSYPFNGFNSISTSPPYKDTFVLTTKPYSTFNNPNFPDYNSFESEFTTAKTPWITAQPFNRSDLNDPNIGDNRMNVHQKVQDLFRFRSLDDGDIGNKYRIKINPVLRGTQDLYKKAESEDFATFDIYIFEYDARSNEYTELEYYQDVNLDPESDNYIGFQIGTINKYYDFTSDQIVEEGLYENRSQYLRVEIHDDIEYKTIHNQHELIPSGFRSYPHINIKKDPYSAWYGAGIDTIFNNGVYQLPPMYALNYYEEYDTQNVLISAGSDRPISNNWGVVFNQSKFNGNEHERRYDVIQQPDLSPHFYYTKYFLNGSKQDFKNIWVEEDNYLNSFFHLEKIAIKKEANGDFSTYNNVNKKNMLYKHSGRPFQNNTAIKYFYLNLNDDSIWEDDRQLKNNFENKLSFDFFTYGGFDGVDIRDNDKRNMRNDAIIREFYDSNEVKSTYSAYDKAIDIAMNDANCAGDIFVVPGIREIPLVQKCVQKCDEDRRHFYIADIGGSVSSRFVTYTNLDDSSIVVKNSLGIMGRHTFVQNEISNVNFNINNLTANDERFLLGQDEGPANVYYSYKKVLQDQYSSIIANWKGLDIRSRYLFPVFGDLSVTSNPLLGITFQKHISSESFVLGQIAQLGSPRQSLTEDPVLPTYSAEFPDASFKLIDDINLSDNQLNFNLSTKDLRQGAINILHSPSNDNIQLLTENTAYDNRKSVFQVQSLVRTIQEIKKRIKFDIFINDTYINGGFLFAQNSNLDNLYTRLEIQLNFIMTAFLNAGYISNYVLRIPKQTDDQTILDMQNYIIRGSIILQFDQSDTIELTLDNILNDLSLLSDNGQDEVLVPRI